MKPKTFTHIISALLLVCLFGTYSHSQTPCENGMAGSYPCNKVDLLSQVSPQELLAESHGGGYLNDIWGWTDQQTGKEYALVGMVNGTSFVDISDPLNPIVVGILKEHHTAGQKMSNDDASRMRHDGAKSVWRDIKVYKDHAYIVAEDNGHGMQVFDLTQLRNATNLPVNFSETANYTGIGKAHNIVINEATGYAYAVGANDKTATCRVGGLHMINIQDPANPIYAGCYDDDGYTHDAQVVIYEGPDADHLGKEIAFAANEDAITIVDVTDKTNPIQISTVSYTGVAYAHQGWLTEDQRYFVTNDEVDELDNGTNTRSFVWDMLDLENPQLIGTYEAATKSIDHNLYIKGTLVYEANYTSGLRVLSVKDIGNGNLEEVAFFDSYPANDNTIFEGAWSNYPYFESGSIIISDITGGLFVLRHTLDNPETVDACLASDAAIEVVETRLDVNYQWQINKGSGFEDLAEGVTFSGVTTPTLQVANVTEEISEYQYRVRSVKNNDPQAEIISGAAGINIVPEPTALFEYAPPNNNGVVFFNNLSEGADSYLWDFGDGTATSNDFNPTHQFVGLTSTTVTLEVSNFCGTSTYSTVVSQVTGLEEELAQGISVYPNPMNGSPVVYIKSEEKNIRSISLLNINGQRVVEFVPDQTILEKQRFQLRLNSHPEGIYLLRITTDNEIISRKLVLK